MMKPKTRAAVRVINGILVLAVMLTAVFVLDGCGIETESKTKAFTYTDEIGGSYRIEYTYSGDIVLKQYQKYELPFEGLDDKIEDVVKTNAESVADKYKEFDYIKYKYSIENDMFTEEVTINDISDHIKEISDNKLMPIEGAEDSDYISMKRTEEALLASGWSAAE